MTIKLKNIYWDYNFSEEDLMNLLNGKIDCLGAIDRRQLLTRMLEYLNWFDFIKFINKDFFITNITQEFISTIKEQDLQKGLLFVREFLQRDTVSPSR